MVVYLMLDVYLSVWWFNFSVFKLMSYVYYSVIREIDR